MEKHWQKVREQKHGKKLLFIHTPKCGGNYTRAILDKLCIDNLGHKRVTNNQQHKYITFTIIRDPVKRYESMLNFRFGLGKPRKDVPKRLRNIHYKKNVTLNKYIQKMTDKEITDFRPYKTLKYWGENIDIFITIDMLHDFLSFFGYEYDKSKFKVRNRSVKNRGTLNEESISRLKRIYKDDIEFYNQKMNPRGDQLP